MRNEALSLRTHFHLAPEVTCVCVILFDLFYGPLHLLLNKCFNYHNSVCILIGCQSANEAGGAGGFVNKHGSSQVKGSDVGYSQMTVTMCQHI